MSKESGSNCVLQIGDSSSSPTEFTTLAGQKQTTYTLPQDSADLTDKQSGGEMNRGATIRDMTVTCSGQANWPDTDGLEALRATRAAGAPIEAKVVVNAAGANYVGMFHIASLEIDAAHDDFTNYSLTLEQAAAPVYSAS